MKTIVRHGNSEIYSIGKTYYLGNNGKLYLIPDTIMEKIFKEMISKSETEVLISILPKADKILKNLK